MAPYHLAAKMGIASSVVNAWKDGKAFPKACHIRDMVAILGTYMHGRSDVIICTKCVDGSVLYPINS